MLVLTRAVEADACAQRSLRRWRRTDQVLGQLLDCGRDDPAVVSQEASERGIAHVIQLAIIRNGSAGLIQHLRVTENTIRQ